MNIVSFLVVCGIDLNDRRGKGLSFVEMVVGGGKAMSLEGFNKFDHVRNII